MLRYYGDEAVKMYLRVNLSGSSLEQSLATISQTRTFLIKANLKKMTSHMKAYLGIALMWLYYYPILEMTTFMNRPEKFIFFFSDKSLLPSVPFPFYF